MVTAKKTSVTQLEAASGESQQTVFDPEIVDSCSMSTEAELTLTPQEPISASVSI